jgi:AGZA family xanthine/uracil permease-like MFS transporter
MDNVLSAAGTSAAELGNEALAGAGVVYHGLKLFGGGAILAGMILGAIAAFVIDRRFLWAAGYAGAGAVLSFIGLVHGEKVEWNAEGQVALGYLFAALVLLGFGLREHLAERSAAASEEPEADDAGKDPAADTEVTVVK